MDAAYRACMAYQLFSKKSKKNRKTYKNTKNHSDDDDVEEEEEEDYGNMLTELWIIDWFKIQLLCTTQQ